MLWDRLSSMWYEETRNLPNIGPQIRDGKSFSDYGETEPREDRGLVHGYGHLATATL